MINNGVRIDYVCSCCKQRYQDIKEAESCYATHIVTVTISQEQFWKAVSDVIK